MSNYCILRFDKIKTMATGRSRVKHNRREVEMKSLRNPDAGIKQLTFDHKPPERSFSEMFHSRVPQGQKIRKNAVLAVEAVLAYSPGSISSEQIKPWIKANVEWLGKVFGRQNIADAQLHLDEASPHLHVIIIPVDDKGKLNCRSFLGGTEQRMRDLQTDYAKAMEEFGLERGVDRRVTKAKHQKSQHWLAENAMKEDELKAYQAVFGDKQTWDLDTRFKFEDKLDELKEQGNSIEQPIIDTPLDLR